MVPSSGCNYNNLMGKLWTFIQEQCHGGDSWLLFPEEGRKEAGNLWGALVLQLALASGKGKTRNGAAMEDSGSHSHTLCCVADEEMLLWGYCSLSTSLFAFEKLLCTNTAQKNVGLNIFPISTCWGVVEGDMGCEGVTVHLGKPITVDSGAVHLLVGPLIRSWGD